MSRRLVFAFLACVIHIGTAGNLSAQDLIISNARIIVGNGELIERGSIIVRGGRIAAVAAGAVDARGAPTIDARGMTAMPGFIDAHRHIVRGNADRW